MDNRTRFLLLKTNPDFSTMCAIWVPSYGHRKRLGYLDYYKIGAHVLDDVALTTIWRSSLYGNMCGNGHAGPVCDFDHDFGRLRCLSRRSGRFLDRLLDALPRLFVASALCLAWL